MIRSEKKIKLEVKVKQSPLTLNSEALGNGKKLHKLMLWHEQMQRFWIKPSSQLYKSEKCI